MTKQLCALAPLRETTAAIPHRRNRLEYLFKLYEKMIAAEQ